MNWQNMSCGKKIGIGFTIVLSALAIVAVWSILGIGGIVNNAGVVIEGNKLKGEMVQREVDHLNWANQVNALLTDTHVTKLDVETDPHKCAFGKWYYSDDRKRAEEMVPELKEIFAAIEETHNHLHHSAVEIDEHFEQVELELGNFLRQAKTDHLAWVHNVLDVFVDKSIKKINAESDPTKCAFGKWYYSDEVKELRRQDPEFDALMQAIEEPHNNLHKSVVHIQDLIDKGNNTNASKYYLKVTEPTAYTVLAKIDGLLEWHDAKVAGMQKANEIYTTSTKPSLEKVQELLGKVKTVVEKNVMTDEEMLSSATHTKTAVSILSLLAGIAGISLAIIIAFGIANALKRIITGLSDGANQVASASEQVSTTSQQLAEGSSEQASSLEEVSSSLEEMASMTKQSAGNAREADTMSAEAFTAAERGGEAMKRMSEAIDKIKVSSDETAKIIKTIDEIAFQTNLLALNAAVEAARAGEAGMGFAVVAEEVRNLAQRSAEAAKTTAELIEESKTNADNGVVVTKEVGDILGDISQAVQKLKQLISEVATASDEQSQGIGQINSAISNMDKVTQSAAANSEESASASEELSSQAMELNDLVSQLSVLVGGNNRILNISTNQKRLPSRNNTSSNRQKVLVTGTAQAKSVTTIIKPKEVIPLEDDSFGDF
jgi:methyl-accepting chemotaxis protein